MRARRIALSIASLTLLLCGTMSPASANHVAELLPDGTCTMGGEVTNIGPNLYTTKVVHQTKAGQTVGYVCHFSDLPPRSEWYTSTGVLWGPPETGVYRLDDTFWCYVPETPGRGPTTVKSSFVARPNGTATLTCKFER